METIDIKFPAGWEEVSTSQLKFIAKIGLKELTREEFLLQLLCKFSGLKVDYVPEGNEDNTVYCFKKKKKSLFIPIHVVVEACKQLEYVIDEIGILNKSPIRGVSSELHDISFKSYYYCDSLISQYQKTKKKKYLKMAISNLTGRRCFSIFKRKAYMIIIWWNGIRKYLTDKYPYVFSSDGGGSDSTPAEVLQILLSVVNNNRPHDNDAIEAAELHSVLITLNNKLEAYDKQRVSN